MFSNIKPEEAQEWRKVFGSDEAKKAKHEEAAKKVAKKEAKQAAKNACQRSGRAACCSERRDLIAPLTFWLAGTRAAGDEKGHQISAMKQYPLFLNEHEMPGAPCAHMLARSPDHSR